MLTSSWIRPKMPSIVQSGTGDRGGQKLLTSWMRPKSFSAPTVSAVHVTAMEFISPDPEVCAATVPEVEFVLQHWPHVMQKRSVFFREVHFLLPVFLSCSQCAFERGGVESDELCGRYLFVEGRSDFFSHVPVHLLTFCPYDPSAFLARATQCWLKLPIGNSESFPLLCVLCKKHRCWKQNWCRVNGTVPRALGTLRLASAWCTPADAATG